MDKNYMEEIYKEFDLPIRRLSFQKSQDWIDPTSGEFCKNDSKSLRLYLPTEITRHLIYGVSPKTCIPDYPKNCLLIFKIENENKPKFNRFYCIGIHNQFPIIGKLISYPAIEETSGSKIFSTTRRKSFMTPTPLHIPTSKVSPIPSSSHNLILFKTIGPEKDLFQSHLEETLWLHPLVRVHSLKIF
tara:strand:- start:363 stop:923 length:561 start_codon:yes stop_codon:yes gene_type:complete